MKHIRDLIIKQRDGYEIEGWEMLDFVRGITSGEVADASIAAYAMGVFLRGATGKELVSLTKGISDSGLVIKWEGFDNPIVDKHSTGGVGDLTSLVLVPILAACGVSVPLLSGRGLGYAGGTLDKLDSIPGFISQPDLDTFQKVVKNVGCAISGQTFELTPADRRIYRIADSVACAQAEDLIVASIVSKKLSGGADNIIYDVKTGNGAFLNSYAAAKKMAAKLTGVTKACGVRSVACITDMNQPLSYTMGNSLEVREAVDFLTNVRRNVRLNEVVLKLGSELLMQAGVAKNLLNAEDVLKEAIESGAGAEKFGKMIAELGGPNDFIDKFGDHLPIAPVIKPVYPDKKGNIHAIDTKEFGRSLLVLGGARKNFEEELDYSVGVSDIAPISAAVDEQRPIAVVHAKSEDDFEAAAAQIRGAVTVASMPVSASQPILETIKPAAL